MTFRVLSVLAASVVVIVTLFDLFLLDQLGARGAFWYRVVVRIGLLVLVAGSSAAAATKFNWWREHFGRAWTLFFAGYAVLAVSEVMKQFTPHLADVRQIPVLIANVAIVGGYWLMARSLSAAGLDYHGSTARKVVVIILAAVVAFSLTQSVLLRELSFLIAGEPNVGTLASVTADLITFVLVAPLLLITVALRGGQLSWVFGLLAVGTFGWMFNQGAESVFEFIGIGEYQRSGTMAGFVMACSFISAAALAHWMSARRTRRGVQFSG